MSQIQLQLMNNLRYVLKAYKVIYLSELWKILFFHFYFFEVKVHMMEEFHCMIILNIASVCYFLFLFYIDPTYFFCMIYVNQFKSYNILQKHALKKM